jgi:cytochrome c oxidase subunit I+III
MGPEAVNAREPDSAEASPAFVETWSSPPGWVGFFTEVNNQPIGKRFMATAFVFFLLGGLQALLMRLQLAVPENELLSPQFYNELFTMHGSTMMFLFAVPFLEGLAIYLLPMTIGSRDVAYPRLSAYGYWVYLIGGMVFYASYLVGAVPDIGWFGYTPLSTDRFSGISTDFWLLGLSLVEVAGLTAGLEIVVTILKFRAPGMTLARMPLLAWTFLAMGLMILIAFSVLLTATLLLEMDRSLGTAFFDVTRGGSDLLWQHLFWFFGHPEVYIMFLPATGIVSMIVPVFARRPTVGYVLIVSAIVLTAFVSFGLWVHHMFAAGLPDLSTAFFTASSLMIAIASGIQVFAWIATLWGSGPSLRTPLLFVLGFLFLFVLGGLTGVMVAVVPFDVQVHDTYFVVAHFHYVLIGGVIFPIFAALHYWLPKMTGRMLSERLGVWTFWLTFLGFNATFFPMHVMGFLGMARRVYTYPRELELAGYNLLATGGALLMGAGTLLLLINVLVSRRRGAPAGSDPWNADSLEWTIPSPPPVFTYLRPPSVRSRHPLWEDPTAASDRDENFASARDALAGRPVGWRATLVTDAIDARPQAVHHLPGPTLIPLIAAAATSLTAIGVLISAYILAAAAALVTAITVVLWLRPNGETLEQIRSSDVGRAAGLDLLPTGTRSTAWWGTVGTITIVSSAFGALFYTYFYLRLFSQEWPQGDATAPPLLIGGIAYGALIAGAASQVLATRLFERGLRRYAQLIGVGAVALGAVFLGASLFDLDNFDAAPWESAYGSAVHVLAFAMALATGVGVALSIAWQARVPRGHESERASLTLHAQVAGLWWRFLAAVGVLTFVTLYLGPRIG